MRALKSLLLIFVNIALASGATRYVDNSLSTGANDGTSWANAWRTISGISGLSAGDTVYISGGALGASQTYNFTSFWNPTSGSVGNRITYQIGQDSSHNGTVIFNFSGGSPDSNPWVSGPTNVIFSGDAGDNAQHFRLTGYTVGFTNVTANVKITYVNLGGTSGNDCAMTNGFELSYCSAIMTNMSGDLSDHFFGSSFTGSAATDNTIHHNNFSVPYLSGTGTGADIFQANGNGFSVYSNVLSHYAAAYLGNQHADGLQNVGNTSNVAIYGNTFTNIPNYAVYMDAYGGGFVNWKVYNNVCQIGISSIASGSPGGIIAGVDGGFIGSQPCLFTNVVIANNTVVDYHSNQAAISLNNGTGFSATFSGCAIQNNALVNSGPVDVTGNATSTVDHNATVSKASAATAFVTYAEYGATANNLNLRSSASALVGQGATLTSYFTTDFIGYTRTAPWDIGPYAYIAADSAGSSRGSPLLFLP